MYLLIGILFVIFGAVLLFNPRVFYELTESWKNNAAGDPSDLYIFSTRFGGAVLIIVGIVSIVFQFYSR